MSIEHVIEQTETVIRMPITDALLEMDERGRAWIKGANTKVIEVALDWIAYRWDAETIHRQHTHLSLAQIHAALSYYFAHQAEFDAEVERQAAKTEALRLASKQISKAELLARLKEQEMEQAA
ncbi:MAG TPA: DUF433 domain-containing protein [Blastocatellia bacterium]|nr:DUF433 domain-containing protein [Blastocatellia bacterium]HMV82074.1 DUF433 domain-containing protein [Blastocatellia bacterium]HMX25944.1 DUF433 domain-containing protein [Blastocatellia bacterium]HMY70490.1 DUF433 domain-containing protein [Blastocatellia bacterium]HMZ17919.1 DUF433 domain-containing protein [Blastocatellia bacterium]